VKLLDLYRCQGGAAAGYIRAGWDVTGIDNAKRHARYYPGLAYTADALEFVATYGHEYDAIHASPPCQFYTRGNAGRETSWPRSIPAVREALEATSKPYVIENVEDAGWDMRDPVTLCGCMFDLSTIDTDGVQIHLQRPRLFETNWQLTAPRACDHSAHEWVAGAYGGARRDKYEAKFVRRGGYVPPDKAVVKALLGVEHDMTWEGLFECVPPAYTEHIGTALLAHLEGQAAA
jgi:DNA (cytosine-5)-methyltransferase 1